MTTVANRNSTEVSFINKPPSTSCGGFIDVNGIWNNGFACPIKNYIQYFCCGTDNYHYCCPPNHHQPEFNVIHEKVYTPSHIVISPNHSISLTKKSYIMNQQFEEFQRLFLPIFLLTSSILFLVGIAIWFWLYKHKAFYAVERDEVNERNRFPTTKPVKSVINQKQIKPQESIPSTAASATRQMSYPSTEV